MNIDLLHLINGWSGRSQLADNFMLFAAEFLIYLIAGAVAAVMAYLVYRREWRAVILASAAIAASFLMLQIAHELWYETRPFLHHELNQLLEHEADNSFPSDHATASVALAMAVLAFTRFRRTGLALLAAALVVALSRVYVGVHYPIDVASGILIVLVASAVVYAINRWLVARWPSENSAS